MNRRKKTNQILRKKAKQANNKISAKSKPRYLSKAERAAAEEKTNASPVSNSFIETST